MGSQVGYILLIDLHQHPNPRVSSVIDLMRGDASSGIYLVFFFLIYLNISLLAFSQGYGEEGLYTEQEGISSAPMFGSGIVGECHLTDLVIKVGRTD